MRFPSPAALLSAAFLAMQAAGPVRAASDTPPIDLPSGRPENAEDPTELPDLPSGGGFRPEPLPFTAGPETPAVPASPVVAFAVTQVTRDGLSHSPCWVNGDRLVFIRSEADYDPAGSDDAFWRKFEAAGGDEAAPPPVHPVNYARGQLVLREPGGAERTITRFEGRYLKGLSCPPQGTMVAVLAGEPGETPSELDLIDWQAPPETPPVRIAADGLEDFAWAQTGDRLYLLQNGTPWMSDPATGLVEKVRLPPFLRKSSFIALWGGPRKRDLVLAVIEMDRKGRPYGNALYVVDTAAVTAVRIPPPRKGLGTRLEQWLDTATVLYSSTDFTRFELRRFDLKTVTASPLRGLPPDADGAWRWSGSYGIWTRWNGAAFDQISLLLKDAATPVQVLLGGNFRSVALSPSGQRIAVDTGTGGSQINGVQIRRDIAVIEIQGNTSGPQTGKP